MVSESIRKEFEARMVRKEESFGRQIYLLYRSLVKWNELRGTELGLLPLGPGYFHLMFTIGLDGVSNSEMARKAKVSKQAMSKLVRELEQMELIVIQVNEHDSRCNIITLTDKGALELLKIREASRLLTADFEKRLGTAKARKLLALMAELVESLENPAAS